MPNGFFGYAKAAATDAMAQYGSNLGNWMQKFRPMATQGKLIQDFWNNQMSPEYVQARTNPQYKFITDAVDPINALSIGSGGAGVVAKLGSYADKADTINDIATALQETDVTDLVAARKAQEIAKTAAQVFKSKLPAPVQYAVSLAKK